MNKMQMAHDWYMKHVNVDQYKRVDDEELISWSFDYVDAMQAEADERENKTRPKALLTKDKDGKCLHFNHEFGHKKCMDCGASLEEWQPDWSQAPDGAEYWAMDKDDTANFFKNKPETTNGNGWDFGGVMQSNNSHSYQGNWQDSLRKRPQ